MGLILLYSYVPTPPSHHAHPQSSAKFSLFKTVLSDPQLQRLNIGIFCQHLILTSTFFAIPMVLKQQIIWGHLQQTWQFYLPLMLCSFVLMVPLIYLSERKHLVKPVFMTCVALTALCQFYLALYSSLWLGLCSALFIYFIGFNFLEANLPALVSRQAPAANKGTAMGIYSTSQFFGIFAGGMLAGFIYTFASTEGLFMANALIALLWFIIAWHMDVNHHNP